jgi:hypothetical protein
MSNGLGGKHGWPYGTIRPEDESLIVEWAKVNELSWKSSWNCFHFLQRKTHGGQHAYDEHTNWQRFSWLDHVTCWQRVFGSRFLVAQPYSTVDKCEAEVAAIAKFLGMDYAVHEHGWYGHSTIMIVIGRGELKNLPA